MFLGINFHFSSFASSTYSKLLDSTLLIDVICQTLSDSCKHFSQAGIVALRFITTMVKSLFSTKEELNQAYELPFFKLLLQRVYHLTCRRNWFAKLGGCTALRFFVDNFEKDFVIKNTELFMNAFFGVSFEWFYPHWSILFRQYPISPTKFLMVCIF